MNNKKSIKLTELGKRNAFRVPDNYFEGLTDDIMSKLPPRVEEEPQTISLWGRVKPWMYMAAMFFGIALMFRVFSGELTQQSDMDKMLNLTSAAEIEEFFQFYEDQQAESIYRDAVFISPEELLADEN